MPKFIVIDHSLQNLSGHHFEYALHVLTAAEQAGFDPWLITHRDFTPPAEVPSRWNVRPVYRHTRYFSLCFDSGQIITPKQRRFAWLRHKIGLRNRARRRVQRAKEFARDTATAFAGIPLASGDHVFVPTLSEIDLHGLARFLAAWPEANCADWHVQFHLPIYKGCEPDYPQEDPDLEDLRRTYRRAAALAAQHRLHFYTASETLAVQYNRLGVGPFHALPWPHHSALERPRFHAHRGGGSPLRIAYLGGARCEKGYQFLPAILAKLWAEHVERGQVRFVIQSAFDFPLPPTGANTLVAEARTALGQLPQDKIGLVDEPCLMNRQCEIGLLPYDRGRYHARCSSVLVELLAAGVPAVVPAGCWLADQLAEPNRQYHLSLRESQPIVGRITLRQSAHATVPDGADHLLLLSRWPVGLHLCTGGYAQIETTFWADGGRMLGSRKMVVGPALPDRLSTVLVRLPEDTVGVTVAWRNAYGPQPLEFRECELCFLGGNPERTLPLGAVGLAAADWDQMADLLGDVIRNYAHYRQMALQFAPTWAEWHNPARVVSELLGRASTRHRDTGRDQAIILPKPHFSIPQPARNKALRVD